MVVWSQDRGGPIWHLSRRGSGGRSREKQRGIDDNAAVSSAIPSVLNSSAQVKDSYGRPPGGHEQINSPDLLMPHLAAEKSVQLGHCATWMFKPARAANSSNWQGRYISFIHYADVPPSQSFIWARPSPKTGVNTVLEIGTNQAEKRTRQLKQTDWQKLRIASNDKGIA